MAKLVKANEATAARRRVYFHLVDVTDGMTPETGEAGGQPQVSSDGAAFTNTGIGTLTHTGNGRYYADLTQTLVQTAGTQIETRYKSANTAECPGDSVQVVAFDPYDANGLGLAFLDISVGQVVTGVLNADVTGAWPGTSLASTINWLRNYLEGDVEIDNAVTPWAEVVKKKSTATELARKRLRQVGGTNVTAITQVIGSKKET